MALLTGLEDAGALASLLAAAVPYVVPQCVHDLEVCVCGVCVCVRVCVCVCCGCGVSVLCPYVVP